MPLLSRSAVLLAEMAKAYGAADQIEDLSYLDTIVFRSYDLTVVYNSAKDVFAFSAALGDKAPRMNAPARVGGPGGKLGAVRKLRLRRPSGEVRRLYGEVPLAELTFPEFASALDEFLYATAQARAGEPISEERFSRPEDFLSEDLIWFRP